MKCAGFSALVFCFILLVGSTSAKGQWVRLDSHGPLSNRSVSGLIAHNGLLIAETGSQGHGLVYRSSNNGDTWTLASTFDTLIDVLTLVDNSLYAGTEAGLYRAGDDGNSCTLVGLHDTQVTSIISTNNGYLFASTWGAGVFRSSNNGTSWLPVSNGLPNSAKIRGFAIHGHDLFTGANLQGMYCSTDNGDHWTAKNVGLKNLYISALTSLGDNLFTSVFAGGIYRSSDGGEHWTILSIDTNVIQLFLVNGQNIFASDPFYARLFLSTDNGDSWHDKTDSLDPGFEALAISGQFLFAGELGVYRRLLSQLIGNGAGVQKRDPAQTFSIYPNPATSYTTISVSPEASCYAEIFIMNMLGQEVKRVYSGTLDSSEHRFTWEAQAKSCATGVYQCVVRMNGRVQALPIVVQ